MTILLLIRHGENDFVKTHRLAGRLPGVHLNERGLRQAEKVAEALKKAPVKAVYSSPLERARETAGPLAKTLGLEIQTAPGLIEVDPGEWTGRDLKDLRKLKAWKTVQNSPSTFQFPGGETFAEVQARAVTELQSIAARHPQDVVACFSHADVIKLAAAYYLNVPLDSFQRLGADTTSLTVIVLGKDGAVHVPRVNQAVQFEWPEPGKKRTRRG